MSFCEASEHAACKKGCDHCCYRLIPVSNVEAASIAGHLLESGQEVDGLIEKLSAHRLQVQKLRADPVPAIRTPCPFLEQGACTIYEFRPWHCRASSSKDAGSCETWQKSPYDPEMQMREFPWIASCERLAIAAGEGIMAGAVQAGLRPAMLELGIAVEILLSHPDLVSSAAKEAAVLAPAMWMEGFRPKLNEPYGVSPYDASVGEATKKIRTSRLGSREMLPEPGMDPQRALFLLQTPVAPDSEDEILDSRIRFEAVLDRLLELPLDSARLFDALGRYEGITLPYQGYIDRDLNAKFGRLVTEHSHQAIPDLGEPVGPRREDGKLRVGFLSGTLRNHQASRWAIGFLNSPPPDVQTYAFQVGPEYDFITHEWHRRADRFYRLQGSVPEAGRFIKSLELDVLIHLDPQEVARAKQFATFRVAPLQVTMWGSPFSCGFPEISHYLSSDAMEPDDSDAQYTEELIRLPGFGLCYERRLISEPVPFDKGRLGPGLHLLIAQNPLKLLPRRDALFRRVAEEAGTPLLCIDYGDYATGRLKARFARAGVPVTWLPKMSGAEFCGLLGAVDASLDTPDWNGSNTTMEALLAGSPVVTLPGIHLRGRHTLGFYRVLEAEGLVASDEKDYVKKASETAKLKERVRLLDADILFDDQRAKQWFYEVLKQLLAH